MIFGAVLAGGLGSRMDNSNLPKQFMLLGGKPIFICTLEKFLLCSRFDQIYVGVHKEWIDYANNLIHQYFSTQQNHIKIVPGGQDRNETILNIIEELEETFGEDEAHIIVAHDAVRPFLSLRMIEENIDGALVHDAVDTVYAAIDTIIMSKDGKTISRIPNRKQMYQGQTPQSYRVSVLKTLYESLSKEEKKGITDTCQIFTLRNYPVYLVQGAATNIKITTPEDYCIAKAMVKNA